MNAVARKLSHLAESFAVYKERAKQVVNDAVKAPGVARKLNKIKLGAFQIKLAHNIIKGYLKDQIAPYDDDFNQKLEDNLIHKIPVSKIIYDCKPDDHDNNGHCFERSFLMFICNDKATWVHGHTKSLELVHGKDNDSHAWVEIGESVYDPTALLKYQKDLYYKMLKVSNVAKLTHQDIENCPNIDIVNDTALMMDSYLRVIQSRLSSRSHQVSIEK